MKRNKRRHIVPQYEFGFSRETFNLSGQTTLDGERLAQELAERDRARRASQSAQSTLFNLKETR